MSPSNALPVRRRRASPGIAALVRFSAAAVAGDLSRAAAELRTARRAGASRRAAEEAALMVMPNAGYPAALEALRVVSEAWPGRARRTNEGTPAAWRRRGTALCRAVYGPVYRRLLRALDALHPDFAVWVIEEGYGRVLSRPGLDPPARERIAVAILAALAWERQLHSHLLGAARLGAAPRDIRAAVVAGVRAGGARVAPAAARAWRAAFADVVPPAGVSLAPSAGASRTVRAKMPR